MNRAFTSCRRTRWTVCLLFLATSLLVPLEAVFACLMQGDATMKCPEGHCTSDCLSRTVDDGGCMDVIYLPEASPTSLPLTKAAALTLVGGDNPDLPAILPPREVLPDPPTALAAAALPSSTVRPERVAAYLLTQRLRL